MEPLNVHAVLDARPDLLREAYAGPQPRGWRRSLLDAGIDPHTIEHEHEKFAQCLLCGKWFQVFGKHLMLDHGGITKEEYRRQFGPDSELSSEMFRVRKFRAIPCYGIDHWERLWSRYYVIDWIILLHERGFEVNYEKVSRALRTLAHNGLHFFGSWDDALRASGLDPAVIRRMPAGIQWTKTKLVAAVREYAKAKMANKRHAMPVNLELAIRRHFGTAGAAYKAAGLKAEPFRRKTVFPDGLRETVIAALRELEPLKGRARRERLTEICAEHDHFIVHRYGSLRKMAVAEGVDPRWVANKIYRDEADVLHDLDLLEREGITINYRELNRHGYLGLYKFMRKTGWGVARQDKSTFGLKLRPFDPHSGLLKDRMIGLRKRLGINIVEAARMANISKGQWGAIEADRVPQPSRKLVQKIEALLAR